MVGGDATAVTAQATYAPRLAHLSWLDLQHHLRVRSVSQTHSTMAPAKDESHAHGKVFSVSGPVVVAEHMIGCAMYELVSSPDRNSLRSLSRLSPLL